MSNGAWTESGLNLGDEEVISTNEDQRQCQPELMKPTLEGLQDEAVEMEEQAVLGATIQHSQRIPG